MGLHLERALQKLGVQTGPGAGTRIICAPPYVLRHKYENERVWSMSMFESTRLPESFLELLDSYDGVCVPNQFNVEQWGKEHPNVHLTPLGIDPEWWHPVKRVVHREFRVRFFGRSFRKGQDIAPKMFEEAFPAPEKMSPRPVFDWQKVGGGLTEEEIRELYFDAHCVLAPSRGEGWNMLPFQALATGCPTVLSDIPGHPYSWVNGAYTIPCGLSPSIVGGESKWWAGYWWEPEISAGAKQLRWVYENYVQALQEASSGAQEVRSLYTWENTAKAVLGALKPSDALRGEKTVPLKIRQFEIDVIKPVERANIGDAVLTLSVGKANVTADQARVLQRAGYAKMNGNWMTTWEQGVI